MSIFQTKRLRVRKLNWTDLDAFHELQSNAKVMKYTTGRPLSIAENTADLQFVIEKYEDPDNTFWVWAVTQLKNTELIGTCAIVQNEQHEFEIGYRFIERFWGNGFGLEITEALIDYGLKNRNLPALVAYVDVNNTPCINILEQSRFQFIKTFYNETYQSHDRLYKIFKSDL